MKYTDEQIKKALELCVNWEAEHCEKCPLDDECDNDGDTPLRNALDLINRQEAEIARLRKENAVLVESNHILATEYVEQCTAKAKSEAIKEFAERLKARATTIFWRVNEDTREITCPFVDVNEIDNLVKEMVGEGK